MNKELINKYKLEFDHWLNDGKLLCYTEVDGNKMFITRQDHACKTTKNMQ